MYAKDESEYIDRQVCGCFAIVCDLHARKEAFVASGTVLQRDSFYRKTAIDSTEHVGCYTVKTNKRGASTQLETKGCRGELTLRSSSGSPAAEDDPATHL